MTLSATKKRVLSGMRSTARLHLGNYVGALQNWTRLQEEYDCFFMAADWHALTSQYADPSAMPWNIRDNIIDWLSAGVDPERSVVFVQSLVKEHSELALLLGMFTPLPWLERNPTYKDQVVQLANRDVETYGFLGYPVLQAADILLYRGEVVPVGEDQLPHLEITREIARRLNFMHGGPIEAATNVPTRPIFPEPEALLSESSKLPGTDGRKMSKSYGNAIYLNENAENVWQMIRSMLTDPARVRKTDPGNPDVCPVFSYHKTFSTEEDVSRVNTECRTACIGCIDCKKLLAGNINALLDPMRSKRAELEAKPKELEAIIDHGTQRASAVASETMAIFRERLSLPSSSAMIVNSTKPEPAAPANAAATSKE
jgi:tryptophanyl-tRNA synthetase